MKLDEWYPGLWHADVHFAYGGYTYGGLLERSGSKPCIEGLLAKEKQDFPFASAPEATFTNGKTILRFPLGSTEQLYGLGLGYHTLTQTMTVKQLRSDHYGGTDNGRTHVPVPFYVSDAGYGVFIDTAAVVTFYMGGTVRLDAKNPPAERNRGRDDNWECGQRSEFVEVSFDGNSSSVYLFAGSSMTDVVARFNLLCGGGCLPPKWGLGMWQRVHIRYAEDDVKREVSEFQAHKMPLQVIGLEPGWQSNSYPCTHEWDEERFPNPEQFLDDMKQSNVRINLWENMYLSKKATLYPAIAPFCGTHRVWGGAVPDFCTPEAVKIITEQHQHDHAAIGVSGYKIDECDGYDDWLWPDHAEFPSGISGIEMRSLFAVRVARLIETMYRKLGRRTYGLIRASNAGASCLPFCIYNDCYDFNQYMTGLASAGFSGALWCPEVRDAKTGEEWVRRFQMGAFSPMLMLNGWANGAKPWKFPEVENTIRDTIRMREGLLPYLYTAFADYRFLGIPPFRALCMDFSMIKGAVEKGKLSDTENPYELAKISDVVDQYMMGSALLVAPAFVGKKERTVILPEGEWYDYYTGEFLGGNKIITVSCPLEQIPLFVRGGIIPTLVDGILTARCYGKSGEFLLYDDSGDGYEYENGTYSKVKLSFLEEESNHTVVGTVTPICTGYCPDYSIQFVKI